MPKKRDPNKSPGEKIIGLFCLLLFTERPFTLSQLAKMFRCSPQTVLRLIEQIERANHVTIRSWKESGRRYYQARSPRREANVALDADAIRQLLLCRDIVMHMLPSAMHEALGQSIAKASMLIAEPEKRAEALRPMASSLPKGAIDYGPFAPVLQRLFDAIRDRRICTLRYRSPSRPDTSTLTVAPYAIVAFHDGLYLRARMKKALACPDGYYDPTLAVHRIESLEVSDEVFEPIDNVSGGEEGLSFGLYSGKKFEVVVDIVATAAMYVRERTWSSDQRIVDNPDGSLTLSFTATSEPEVIAWVLSFGTEAVLREPTNLRQKVAEELRILAERYV